ncbi:asialoglycoprotein receptor 2 isoform 2-T3 [Dugong dugon]
MAKDFQDIQQLDSEENDHQLGRSEGPGPHRQNFRRENPFWKGTPPPKPFLQRFCSRPRLSLLALGFNVLLLVVICMIGSQSTQLQMELRALKETLNNFSATTLMEVRALSFHGVNVSDRVTFLEAKLEKENEDLKSDHANLLLHLKHYPLDLRILECHITFLQSNGTKCCPVNWMEHEGSCYWFSRSGKTWPEADKYCQLEDAHLVVINSREEQGSPTVAAPGSGRMVPTMRMATRTGITLSRTTGRGTRWEEMKIASKSGRMATGMTICANRCTAGCVRPSRTTPLGASDRKS